MSECLFESISFSPAPPTTHLYPPPSTNPLYSFFLFVFEGDKREAGNRYLCHMLLNEKALLSKQMGFLNIETAACLFNMTVLNSLYSITLINSPLLSLSPTFCISFFFLLNLQSLNGTLAL